MLYFQQKMYMPFLEQKWTTWKVFLLPSGTLLGFWSCVSELYVIKYNTAETVFEVNLQVTYFQSFSNNFWHPDTATQLKTMQLPMSLQMTKYHFIMVCMKRVSIHFLKKKT